MITLPFTDVDTTAHDGQPDADVPAAVSTCTVRPPYSSRSTRCTRTPGRPNSTDVSSFKPVASLVQLRRNSQTSRGHGRPASGALADRESGTCPVKFEGPSYSCRPRAGASAARKLRFVKAARTGFVLDEAALARARALTGLKGCVTNIDAAIMPAGEVIARYHDLWRVEQSFRMSKSDLAARPMFARTSGAIEAHMTIVFTAFRRLPRRPGPHRPLDPPRPTHPQATAVAAIEINGVIQIFTPALGPIRLTSGANAASTAAPDARDECDCHQPDQ